MPSSTMYEGQWTEPKGVGSRVEGMDGWGKGAWWGENGDNCT